VDVAFLGLEFSSWPFGTGLGTVKPYGPPNYDSGIEYTYYPSGLTYFNPMLTGMASVPEPSSIVLSFAGIFGAVVLARFNRRKIAA
jgi:PEP-CTERM motif